MLMSVPLFLLRLLLGVGGPAFSSIYQGGIRFNTYAGLAYGLSALLGLSDLETAVLVLFAALPGAPSAYILARQLDGDAPLMAAS